MNGVVRRVGPRTAPSRHVEHDLDGLVHGRWLRVTAAIACSGGESGTASNDVGGGSSGSSGAGGSGASSGAAGAAASGGSGATLNNDGGPEQQLVVGDGHDRLPQGFGWLSKKSITRALASSLSAGMWPTPSKVQSSAPPPGSQST